MAGTALATIGSCTGCTAGWNDDGAKSDESLPNAVPELPRVENPPDAVYVPTHREAMIHLPTAGAGEYALSPMITYPHRFWLVTGTEREAVVPSGGRGVHLMFTLWDRETGQVLPVDAGAQMRTFIDGELVDQRAPWPMISQTMGFHFGDNVSLPADGTYTVEVDLNPINIRKTGAFADRFDQRVTAEFQFQYDAEFREEVINGVEYLDESDWGRRGAIAPPMAGDHDDHHHDDGHSHGAEHGGRESDHGHEADGHDTHGGDYDHEESRDHDDHEEGHDHGEHQMMFSALPETGAYPGVDLGEHESGDARFVVRYLSTSRLADGGGYVLVSPRTPYNRIPLADMALSVVGDVETALEQTLDSEFGLHYGAAVDLTAGDAFKLVVEGPPQVSRHAGYETAFLEMSPMQVSVPE